MPTTAEMLLKIAECLLMPRYGMATGGTNATLVDITMDEPDELFNGGTLWFLTGANAGKSTKITTWDEPTHTFTFPVHPGVVQGADQYAALDARYYRDLLVGALNQALAELGPFDATDTTLTTIGEQEVYTLPAGVANVKRLQYSLETVAPFNYAPPDHWWIERGGELHLSPSYIWTAGANMRLIYEKPHARVYADADPVTDDVSTQRLAWTAALAAVRARLARGDTADRQTADLEKKIEQQALALQRAHPIRRIPKDQHWNDLP